MLIESDDLPFFILSTGQGGFHLNWEKMEGGRK